MEKQNVIRHGLVYDELVHAIYFIMGICSTNDDIYFECSTVKGYSQDTSVVVNLVYGITEYMVV